MQRSDVVGTNDGHVRDGGDASKSIYRDETRIPSTITGGGTYIIESPQRENVDMKGCSDM